MLKEYFKEYCMKTKIVHSLAATVAIVGMGMLVGCSGGGSSDSTTTPETAETVLVGTFVDSAVEGLTYKGTLSGTTNKDGHYSFKGSEKVEFLLGNSLSLGSLTPKTSQVSVLDFFDSSTTVDDPKVQKLIVLLQSLDVDGDTSNGITITAETVTALEEALGDIDLLTVDFTAMPLQDIKDLLATVVANTTTPDDVVVNEEDAVEHFAESLYGPQPPVLTLPSNAKLACDAEDTTVSVDAKDFNASLPVRKNVSSKGSDGKDSLVNSHNAIARLNAIVDGQSADGNATGTRLHPIVISYNEHIDGSDYEMGLGSADIGDPKNRDALYFAISLDDGETWKHEKISNSEDKSSIKVTWDGDKIPYGGDVLKPKMAISGNNIMMAWHDKYCPSGNPLDLAGVTVDGNTTYPADFFAINGSQGSIDYEAVVFEPSGETVYEVPFSCVWTARGAFDPVTKEITWHAPVQLTSGKRDSNHIWLEGSPAGFAMAWQEDTKGLRSGKGEGPGDGWSGATTNHGSDIWYSSLKMGQFADINGTDENTTKPKSLHNFHYPVRITDNEQCSANDTKPYCKTLCNTYGSESSTTNSNAATTIERCYTYDVDMLTNTQVILNGDTGASRSALEILKTDTNQSIVILSYEETKGLSENTTGTGDQDQGTVDTIIEFEGKSVYFESFDFNAIDEFNATDPDIIQKMAMPLVSAGNIVNMKVPDENNASNMIYENARRVVIGSQVDSCDADKFTFALLYKQSFETQGASSDMFVRVNNGFTYDSFVPLSDATAGNLDATNISSTEVPTTEVDPIDYNITWSSANLDDNTYYNANDNTFSPRIFLRGNSIFTGFVYTPDANKTASVSGNMPSNFYIHRYVDGAWQGPQNITRLIKASATTVDPRLINTPKGTQNELGSDASNPNVIFLTWGEIDYIDNNNKTLGKTETDLFYKRSVDGGVTWDAEAQVLSNKEGAVIEEKEVNSFVSPDGKTLYNVWLQEEEHYDSTDPDSGLDTWFGRVDFNISNILPN